MSNIIIKSLLSQPEGEDTMKLPLHDGICNETKLIDKTTCIVLTANN